VNSKHRQAQRETEEEEGTNPIYNSAQLASLFSSPETGKKARA